MLRRYRRLWCLVAVVLLAIPMVVNLLRSETAVMSTEELRMLAPVPSMPRRSKRQITWCRGGCGSSPSVRRR